MHGTSTVLSLTEFAYTLIIIVNFSSQSIIRQIWENLFLHVLDLILFRIIFIVFKRF